jgi:hypothetical protein
MRGVDSDDHGATTPGPACAEAQECAVPMSAVNAQLPLDPGAFSGSNHDNRVQPILNERVGRIPIVQNTNRTPRIQMLLGA